MFYKRHILNSKVINKMKTLNHEEVYAFYYKKVRGKITYLGEMRFGIGDKYEIKNLNYKKVLRTYKELRADALVIVHNHPVPFLNINKMVKPSYPDLDFTWKIGEICEQHRINFVDHMIVSKNGYFSFVENDLIKYTAI